MRVLFAAAVTVMLSGCAYTFAYDIEPGQPYIGFKVPECKPLVQLDQTGLKIVLVPNPNKAYAVKFGTFLAKNDVEVEFGDSCGLKKVKSNQDSTAFIQFLTAALDKIPDAGGGPKPTGDKSVSRVELYEIVFDEDGTIQRLRPLLQRDLPVALDG